MSFIKSLVLGCNGSYQFWGTDIHFLTDNNALTENQDNSSEQRTSGMLLGSIERILIRTLASKAFGISTLGYAHVLAHELGHALSYKLFFGGNTKVTILTDSCAGLTTRNDFFYSVDHPWKLTFFRLAGPMAGVAFSSAQVGLAILLKKITLPGAFILGTGGLLWIIGELFYAIHSIITENETGDFYPIKLEGNPQFALASFALISQCALSAFALIKLARLKT